MTDLTASLVLKLQDQLSGGLQKVQDQLEELTSVADKTKLAGLSDAAEITGQLNSQLEKTPGLLSRIGDVATSVGHGFSSIAAAAQSGMGRIAEHVRGFTGRIREFQEASSNLINQGFGAAAEGFAVYEPMKKYAEYENIVRHIGITEGLSGPALDARIAHLGEFLRADALRTGQSSESVAQAYQDLTQMGIHEILDTIIQAHSRAATAYNTTAEALGPAVGALIQTMKVPAGELATTMSAMAQASKEGRFKIEDFSRELPGVAAQMARLGMSGRKGADLAFASLETVMRGSSQPSQAAHDFVDLLQYFSTPFARRHFAKQGISLHNVLERGVHQGDVIGAVMDAFKKRVKGKDLVQTSEYFGAIFHNQQAGQAMATLMQQRKEFEQLRAQLDKVSSSVVERDFISAFKAPVVQMRIMAELLDQISERFGQGFVPVLQLVNLGLWNLNEFLKTATQHYPRLTAVMLGGIGGLLLFGAALGLVAAILPVVWTGLTLLFSPLVAALAVFYALAAEAEDIYTHWGRFRPFFVTMWEGVKETFRGFLTFVSGFFTGDLLRAQTGIIAMGRGLATLFSGYWGAVKQVFTDFAHWVDSWSSGLATRILTGIASGWGSLVAGLHGLIGRLSGEFDNSMLGRLLGLAQAKTQSPSAANDNGAAAAAGPGRVDVHVHADPGSGVSAVQSSGAVNVHAPLSAPARGATVGRP